jgi:hypothetical protein
VGVIACVGLVLPSAAGAAVQAPGFSGGPEVVNDGLLWAGSSSGRESVFLSTATTGTDLLVPDAELSAVHVDDGWVVVANQSGPMVGRIGRPLRVVRTLRRCPPIQANTEGDRLEAVADDNLYAVVRASCFGRRPGDAELLVRVRLGTGNLLVIGEVSSGAISLAAAGPQLALTYEVGVEILDSHDGRLLYRLAPPSGTRGDPDPNHETQLDAKGDVLVTGFRRRPLPGGGEAAGWWGSPKTPIAHPLESGFEPPVGGRLAYASLSDGRIAYATRDEGQTRLNVLNLATGEARTVVTFSGAVSMEGFSLSGTLLAWAQQKYAYTTKREGPPLLSCVTEEPVGSPELTETTLSPAGPPVVVNTSPGPRPAGVGCPPPP